YRRNRESNNQNSKPTPQKDATPDSPTRKPSHDPFELEREPEDKFDWITLLLGILALISLLGLIPVFEYISNALP
ncbi:MAG: hypothetical protein ACPGWR_33950, partial [Ardenticatenaceae bacterium]